MVPVPEATPVPVAWPVVRRRWRWRGSGGGDGRHRWNGRLRPVRPTRTCSEWGLFKSIPDQIPEDGVVPFDVTSALFTDDAIEVPLRAASRGRADPLLGHRALAEPAGARSTSRPSPTPSIGTMPELGYQLIETRLIVFGENKTDTWTYVYPEGDNSDAVRINWGPILPVSLDINALAKRSHSTTKCRRFLSARKCHGIETPSPVRSAPPRAC